MKVAAKQTR